MTDITIADLTNKTSIDIGDGIFDVLSESVKLHLQEEYDESKITGKEYATVWLGTIQSVLQQSINFILAEQEAGKKVDLLDKQIAEAEERIDLVIAQTAKIYEDIDASQAQTRRENLLNTRKINKLIADVTLVEAQTTDQQYITNNIRPEELLQVQQEVLKTAAETDRVTAEATLITSRNAEVIAGTLRADKESTQKVLLMSAQTLGFASDTKQKVLKQMHDGYAVNLSIAGVGNVPEANQDAAIDQLAQELLTDVGSTVVIQTSAQVPSAGEEVVPIL